jgi:ABC-type dipeptide/oligopeptide/nickel transport system ATPase component
MPCLTQHPAAAAGKILIVGDSGSGKSGALVSLALAGYKLRILDWDNGLDIVRNQIAATDPKALQNVVYETCTDKMKSVGGIVVPDGVPKAWVKGMDLLTEWKMPEITDPATKTVYPAYNLGKLETWGPDTVLVVDTLTFMSLAAMRYVCAVNGRSGKAPWQSDWGEAMRLVEDCLGMLYSDSIRCHIIVMSHIVMVTNESDQVLKGMPMAIGQKLSPKIGRYFNTVLQTKTRGSGAQKKHVILTRGEGLVDLKVSAPQALAPEYPQDTGLASIFKVLFPN